jgi:hypothetical protein
MVERVAVGGFEFGLGWWAAPFTVIWLVSGINAFNFTDGVDGLASLLGLIAVAAMSVAAFLAGNTVLILLLLPVGGGLCGFLLYNRPPARIYLGDAGSMLIGLYISALATLVVRTSGGAVALVPLVLLAAVPLSDMALAVIRRTQTGVFFWRADRFHMHHRLLERGWSPPMVLASLGALSGVVAMLSVAALITRHEGWACAAAIALALGAVQSRFFGHYEWSLVKRTCGLSALAATASWWSQRLRSQLPATDELIELPDEAVWDRFGHELDKLTAARVDVTTGSRGRIHWRRHWSSPSLANRACDEFALQIKSETAEGGWCVTRAELNPAQRMHPSALFTLIATLKHFSHVWATRTSLTYEDISNIDAEVTRTRAAA